MILQADELADSGSLDSLYRHVGRMRMAAGWTRPTSSPALRCAFRPHHWSYAAAKATLDAASRLIGTDVAERRNLVLVNPGEEITYATVPTMIAAYQMVRPGERTRMHRHTPNALRLILDVAPGACTIVDGRRLPMLPGDVVLTPQWSWHGHINEGNSPAYWLDFLDVPLMDWFGLRLFEQHPDEAHTSAALSEHSPMQFRWSDSALKLDRAAARTDGCQVVEAALGNPALATIALSMMRLPGSAGSVLCTSTANAIYAVVHGSGTTEVGEEEFAWQRGDVVAVPAQHPHAHRANECAVLLTVTDAPTMSWLQGRHDPAS